MCFQSQVQGRFPQEVELDAADNDFLAAFVSVIEAHGQVRSVQTLHSTAWLSCSSQIIACRMLSKRPYVSHGCCFYALQTLNAEARAAKLIGDHQFVIMVADKLGIPFLDVLLYSLQSMEAANSRSRRRLSTQFHDDVPNFRLVTVFSVLSLDQ